MGRIWQVLLVAGLLIWLFIVWRGLRGALREEKDKGGLVHLLFYSAWTIGFMLVSMGLVSRRSILRSLYFQIIILMGSGIIGTGHHYYWIGDPAMWLA